MFLGIEATLLDFVAGVGIGLVFLVLFFAYTHERKERLVAREFSTAWRNLADRHWDSYKKERHAHRFWLAQAGDANRQLSEAYADLEVVRTEAEEAESALEAESHQREVAEGLADELEVALRFVLADLEVAEETIEELEEESDDLEESANEALAGWARADEIAETTLAWGERILDMAERAEKERL